MNYLQQTIERDVLQNIIVLPAYFQNCKMFDVIIKPADDEFLLKQNSVKHDIDIINANIGRFNREAEENLLFQADL